MSRRGVTLFRPRQIIVQNMAFTVSNDGHAGIALNVTDPTQESLVFPIERQAIARLREIADQAEAFFNEQIQDRPTA